MITATPLPRWKDLAAGIAGAGAEDSALARPWRREGDIAFWFSRSAWALKAIADGFHRANPEREAVLWLPGYFCNQSTAPVRESRARLVFYPVGPDLEPDWQACRSLARNVPPDLFVLVHYFGVPRDAAAARGFCNEHRALLIEDAAHVLVPVLAMGEQGDCVFYSPNKTLAVPDGGVLLVRDSAFAEHIAASIAPDRPAPAPGAWMAKRALQKILPAFALGLLAGRHNTAFADDPPFAPLPLTPGLSLAARRMLARATDDLPAAASRRLQNERTLRVVFAGAHGCRPYFDEADIMAAPYRFVLRCKDKAVAAELFSALRARGCPVESWPDLAPEVKADPQTHAAAIALRETLLFLPVHQTADAEALRTCCGPYVIA